MELQTAAEAARASVDARLAMRSGGRTAAVSERAAALEADAESERQGRRAAVEDAKTSPRPTGRRGGVQAIHRART